MKRLFRLHLVVRAARLALCAAFLYPLSCDTALFASAELYGVRIARLDGQAPRPLASTGNAGLFLGENLFLTAAHVVYRHSADETLQVQVAGRLIDATVRKMGSFDTIDLALLEVSPDSLPVKIRGLRPPQLCRHPSMPGTPVLVVEPGSLSYSRIVSPDILPPDVPRRFDSLIRDVITTGNSGSALFDLDRGCLMGIMSAKIELTERDSAGERLKKPVAKYFVSASRIKDFLTSAGAAP